MRQYRDNSGVARVAGVAGCLGAALALFAIPTPAWAYLDPASGSMFLQLLLGGIAGAAVALRLFWRRLVTRLRPKRELPAASEDV